MTNEEIIRLKEFEFSHSNLYKNNKNYIGNLIKEEAPMLVNLLTEEVIDVNVTVDNWEEAVRYGGGLLEKNNIVEQEYVEAMINTVKEFGPYIVIAPGIAMPHASSKNGVNKTGMSLLTLNQPVNFGNKENDPVEIVVSLATVDHTTHLKALEELVTYLSNEKIVSEIKKANSKQEIVDILNLYKKE